MRHSIKFKFFAGVCAITVAFVGILAALNVTFYGNYYLWQRERSLSDIYATVKGADYNDFDSILNTVVHIEDTQGVRLTLVAGDGTVRYDSTLREQLSGGETTRENLFFGLSVADRAMKSVKEEDLDKNGMAFVNVFDNKRSEEFLCLVGRLDDGYLIARMPFTYVKQSSSFNLLFLAISGGITLIICTCLSFIVARHFTRPLISIGEVANAMADLDFSKKYDGPVKDEIGQLGQSINRLSEHLEKTIDELKQSNAQLEQEVKEKEKIDALRQEFIINASHELKTPIALIQGYAEGLQAGIAETPEDRDYYCSTIVDEAVRMNNLVMQMLNLSKLELGREAPNWGDIDLDELIGASVSKTAVLADARNLKVEYQPCGLHVMSDYSMLEQVVGNYMTNAIRYTPEGGAVRLTAAADADNTTITVFNEGEGVTEDELPRLWDKFYRTDKARSRALGGSGVGLSIVRAMAEVLRGACGARNAEGGIEFWFSVPNAAPQTAENPENEPVSGNVSESL